jgi:LysM repeat protein
VLVAAFVGTSAGPAWAGDTVHVVASGETLWKIARKYGCEVAKVTKRNKLETNVIHPGDKLKIPRCKAAPKGRVEPKKNGVGKRSRPAKKALARGLEEHAVVSGDTLGKIAKQYDTSVEDLMARNGLDSHLIKAGETLVVLPNSGSGPQAIIGQSVGRPSNGKLVNASVLPKGGAYYIRRPHRAYGTSHTVYHVRRAANAVRRRFPKLHKLAVGDLSVKKGGKITMHNSHQSGRDVDLGFYFKRKPKDYPEQFVVAQASNLEIKATWMLLETLGNTIDAPHGIERMYISYDTQKLIYDLARKAGVAKKKLDAMFQYPGGKDSLSGIVRHEPYHDDHVHVRFKCPQGDSTCY